MAKKHTTFCILMACGPVKDTIGDSIDALEHHFQSVSFEIVFVDDYTKDGTYDFLQENKKSNWHILRNEKKYGYINLAQTLSKGYKYIIDNIVCDFVFKMDTDTLVIGNGLANEVNKYMKLNPHVGIFGVYSEDYNRARFFDKQKKYIDNADSFIRKFLFIRPNWCDLLRMAEKKGYNRGENVFGGAYFLRYDCLKLLVDNRFLNYENMWINWRILRIIDIVGTITKRQMREVKGSIAEDVYFSMLTVASGYEMGHFAAPYGPLCLEYKGLPYPPCELVKFGFKVIHSVDKGPNTSCFDNSGLNAREYFRKIRKTDNKAK